MTHNHPRGTIHKARAEDIYPTIPDASVRLIISDGPYGIGKASWDRQNGAEGLRDWYRPHVEAWGRIAMASATVYVWGTGESWSALDPMMRSMGWTHRSLLIWDKGPGGSIAVKSDPDALFKWPDVTEVCGMYQREALASPKGAGTMIAYTAGADERNWIRAWLASEWGEAGMRNRDADRVLGKNGMAGHYFGASQWSLPTWDAYERLAKHAQAHGPARDRPYFVHPAAMPAELRASYDHLRAEYDHLRAEYDQMRCPFNWPKGTTNVWRENTVRGSDRLMGPDGEVLHPCQKPTLFARRMILASSRPGELVLEPFGGTCRVALACEAMTDVEARRYVCIEPDEDGRDYLAAVNKEIAAVRNQGSLFSAWGAR